MATTKLRFAALVRVSTEQQEKTGESLQTQRAENLQTVRQLGGTIADWYGGQEHATPGHEKKEIDRLLSDARKGKFDAVVVANADRWSRDNGRSQDGLDILQTHKVRFFVGVTEYDLFNPEHALFLGMSAVIGRFQAHHQTRKSLQNRIARAKRGVPACGRLPFGRTFDWSTEKWGVDSDKRAIIKDCAKRYLAGESMGVLAKKHGINHAFLHKTLMERCGTNWSISFDSDVLNIHENVPIEIPRLLDAATIKALQRRATANKTYAHGHATTPYLFGRMVFCRHCGYALTGQLGPRGVRYYRHGTRDGAKACPHPIGYVRADELEEGVIRQLFACFGNPAAVARAIEAATPNPEMNRELLERQTELEKNLEVNKAARARHLRTLDKGLIPEAEVHAHLAKLKDKNDRQLAELERIRDSLQHVPSPAAIKAKAEQVAARFTRCNGGLDVRIRVANHSFERMTWDEKRALAEMVFSGHNDDGSRMGIYIEWIEGQVPRRHKTWRFTVRGHLIDEVGIIPMSKIQRENLGTYGSPRVQEELVTSSADTTQCTSRPRCSSTTMNAACTTISAFGWSSSRRSIPTRTTTTITAPAKTMPTPI